MDQINNYEFRNIFRMNKKQSVTAYNSLKKKKVAI